MTIKVQSGAILEVTNPDLAEQYLRNGATEVKPPTPKKEVKKTSKKED